MFYWFLQVFIYHPYRDLIRNLIYQLQKFYKNQNWLFIIFYLWLNIIVHIIFAIKTKIIYLLQYFMVKNLFNFIKGYLMLVLLEENYVQTSFKYILTLVFVNIYFQVLIEADLIVLY
jgi:hypothetical protein